MNEQEQQPIEEQISPEMEEQMREIKEILNTPIIDTTMALNIIINAVQVCYDNEKVFNDLDRALISKALEAFKEKIKSGTDFVIQVTK